MILLLVIPLVLVVAAVSFWVGVRYCTRTMLPVILARMTPKELSVLAKEAAQIRQEA